MHLKPLQIEKFKKTAEPTGDLICNKISNKIIKDSAQNNWEPEKAGKKTKYKLNIYQRSAVKWRTVHEHIVADAFHSKKSSSVLLVHKHSKHRKINAFQVDAFQGMHLTTTEVYMKTQVLGGKLSGI